MNKQEFNCLFENYYKHIIELLKQLNTDELIDMINEIKKCYINDNTIFLIGNGGSASTCAHMANDIGIGVNKNADLKKPIKIISLADNTSIITAISNDHAYDDIFMRQLELYFKEGDLLIAISASGKSRNLVKAVEWANFKQGKTISIVGFDGGILKDISDVSIHIKSEIGDYGSVEDIHMIINHFVSLWLKREAWVK